MAPSNFQTGLPLHTQQTSGESWKDRNCPGMRTCWSFSVDSFSLNTSDKAVLARRICMLAVLGVRTAMSVLSIILEAFGIHLVGLIIGIILGLIGFFFIAWCLARIGDAEGSRKVLGARIGRWHFDVFLLAMAIIHVGIFVGAFYTIGGAGIGTSWVLLWLVIFAAAWITTWEPEPEISV